MSDDTNHEVRATQRLARLSGILYLIIAVCGMFAAIVISNLVVSGDAAGTVDNVLASLALFRGSLVAWIIVLLADVSVAITLFVLLKPAGATLSLLAAAFRVVYSAIQAVNLLNLFNALFLLTNAGYGAGVDPEQVNALTLFSFEAFDTGFLLALLFFGIHLIVLGYLLFTSRYVPPVIGILLVAGGIGYIADSLGNFFVPDYSAVATAILLAPAVAGELGLTVWLLVMGVKVRRPAASQHQGPAHTQGTSAITV